MNSSKKSIAIVGLGRMGSNIARHLHEKGYEISAVYDVLPTTTQDLAVELDCTPAANLSEITAAAETIITVVSDDESMRAIYSYEGDNLLLENAAGKTFINCATVSPDVHRSVEALCEAASAHSLEACMASSISQARNGELYLMIAGKESTYQQCSGLLNDLATNLRYIGPAGKAAEVKALVNMVMNINTAALAEGLALGDALGVDLAMLCEVFAQTGADSRVLETDAIDMIDRDHECWFSASHAAKDSGIANRLGEELQLELPLSVSTEKQFQKMVELGLGELDKSGIAELTFLNRNPVPSHALRNPHS